MSEIDGSKPRITEPEARAAYLAMKGRRSLRHLIQHLNDAGTKAPSLTTMAGWSKQFEWTRLAAEHDDKVAAQASEEIAQAAVELAVDRAELYQDLAEESAKKALETVKKLNPEELKASDARALSEISERAGKMAELLSGRATDRTEHLTQDRLNALMRKMGEEADERIRRAGAVTRH